MEKIYDIWFSRIEINNKIKYKLLNKFSTEEIWKMSKKELENNLGEKYFNYVNNILNEKYRKDLDKYMLYFEKNNIQIISFKDSLYPEKLYYIENKPIYIFVRGNIHILNKNNVAIIGSRNATEYGKKVAKSFAKEIANKNINIVSGLAIGIDKYAHLGCLESHLGKTIAVLGTGLADNDIYPFQNKKVFERILEKDGAVISEYIIGTKPLKYHFPERNRIISGLSDKIIVVEAKENSGSLITVDFGLEQGKDIYAVPGNIMSLNSKGTNKLIKEGAYLLENVEDLF